VQSLILYGHFQIFHRKLFYAHNRIQSTHSQNAFSSFHFNLCALFCLRFWFVSYMAATATFQLTFPEVCWSNIIVTNRGSPALCREMSFTCRNAINQTEFDNLYVRRKTHPGWRMALAWATLVFPKAFLPLCSLCNLS